MGQSRPRNEASDCPGWQTTPPESKPPGTLRASITGRLLVLGGHRQTSGVSADVADDARYSQIVAKSCPRYHT